MALSEQCAPLAEQAFHRARVREVVAIPHFDAVHPQGKTRIFKAMTVEFAELEVADMVLEAGMIHLQIHVRIAHQLAKERLGRGAVPAWNVAQREGIEVSELGCPGGELRA